MKKVLFIWDVNEDLQTYIRSKTDPKKLQLCFPGKDEVTLLKEAKNSDAIVGWRPDPKLLLEATQQVKLFVTPGAGVQHLLEHQAALENCTVSNCHGNAFFTAEHIVAMLLSLTNKLIPHHQWMKEGKWRLGDNESKSISLKHRSIGLMGYGKVGQSVHNMLRPFCSSIKIFRNHPEKGQYGYHDIDRFISSCDVLISTLPLTEKTEGIIGQKELKLLGENGILIQAGRGKTIQEKALFEALSNKTISSAAIDVWYDYKVKANNEDKKFPTTFPFYQLDNVLLSPHRAASPMDDLERWDEVIENLNRLGDNRVDFLNVVDLNEGY